MKLRIYAVAALAFLCSCKQEERPVVPLEQRIKTTYPFPGRSELEVGRWYRIKRAVFLVDTQGPALQLTPVAMEGVDPAITDPSIYDRVAAASRDIRAVVPAGTLVRFEGYTTSSSFDAGPYVWAYAVFADAALQRYGIVGMTFLCDHPGPDLLLDRDHLDPVDTPVQ